MRKRKTDDVFRKSSANWMDRITSIREHCTTENTVQNKRHLLMLHLKLTKKTGNILKKPNKRKPNLFTGDQSEQMIIDLPSPRKNNKLEIQLYTLNETTNFKR